MSSTLRLWLMKRLAWRFYPNINLLQTLLQCRIWQTPGIQSHSIRFIDPQLQFEKCRTFDPFLLSIPYRHPRNAARTSASSPLVPTHPLSLAKSPASSSCLRPQDLTTPCILRGRLLKGPGMTWWRLSGSAIHWCITWVLSGFRMTSGLGRGEFYCACGGKVVNVDILRHRYWSKLGHSYFH